MSDLVERLRDEIAVHDSMADDVADQFRNDIAAACDEIERLQAQIKAYPINEWAYNELCRENERLRAERDGWKESRDSRVREHLSDKDEIERLLHEIDVQCSSEYVERILKENERLRAALVYFYNQGYMTGHHDTVEGMYTDVHADDVWTYHDDIVADIAREALKVDK